MDWVLSLIVFAGLLHLPIFADMLHHLCPNSGVARLTSRAVKPILVSLVWGLSLLALWFFFTVFVWEHLDVDSAHLLQSAIDAADARVAAATKGTGAAGVAGGSTLEWLFVLVQTYARNVAALDSTVKRWALLHVCIALWLWLNMGANYTLAVTRSAGTGAIVQRYNGLAPATAAATATDAAASDAVDAKKAGGKAGGNSDDRASPCKVCGAYKVPSTHTHHCRVCNSCVVFMDHHCPFTGNCVGLLNFSYFWLWLTFTLTGIAYAAYLTVRPFAGCVAYPALQSFAGVSADTFTGSPLLRAMVLPPEVCDRLGSATLVFAPTALGGSFVALLWGFETFLLVTRQSTVEFIRRANWRVSSWFPTSQQFADAANASHVFVRASDGTRLAPLRKTFGALIRRGAPLWRLAVPFANIASEAMYTRMYDGTATATATATDGGDHTRPHSA